MATRPPLAGTPGAASSRRPGLRVGVTGHRLDRLPARGLETLQARLRDVFAALDAARARTQPRGRGISRSAMPPCVLVSALAEGADRIAVDAAPDDWELDAILPMPLEFYRQDFLAPDESRSASAEAFDAYLARARSVTEVPLLVPDLRDDQRPAQYEALGRALVRHIDCLVAVWDGKPPRGPGGTASVVAQAIERGLPVIWIDPLGEAREIKSRSGGDDSASLDLGPLDDASLDAIVGRAFRGGAQ